MFLTRKQIERLFTLPTNTTNKDLLWLVTAGYLERRYRADTFAHFQEPVYYLGRLGWQMAGRPVEEFKAYQRRVETRAERTFGHTLAVYDVYLKFMLECKVRRIVTSDDHSWQEMIDFGNIPDGWIHRVSHIKSTFVPMDPSTAPQRLLGAGLSHVRMESRSGAFLLRAVLPE